MHFGWGNFQPAKVPANPAGGSMAAAESLPCWGGLFNDVAASE